VVLDRAQARNVDEGLRCELQHIGHHADIGVQTTHRRLCLGRLQRRELVHGQALLDRGHLQRVGPAARLFRGTEHRRDLVSAFQELLQHGLAEVLLADDHNLHGGNLRVISASSAARRMRRPS
jgi:hypothetical protein